MIVNSSESSLGVGDRPPLQPGRLRLLRAVQNPNGGLHALYLATGDAHTSIITSIDPDPEVDLVAAAGTRQLRLFHFNDLHNCLQVPDAGSTELFSRIVHRYRAARAAAAPDEIVLLLSGGDDHTGTPLDELLGWAPEELVIDPAYAAYSAAGVDAATLGNHDLDRGGAVLAAGIRCSAAFPILSANIDGSTSLVAGRDYFPAAIAVAQGLRIGLVGLTTAIDTRTATPSDPGLVVTSPLATLRNLLPALAALTDVVIVMSHCGYGSDEPAAAKASGTDYLAEGDVALARLAASLTDRPVLVLGAHSHTVLNANGLGPDTLIDGVPIIQAGGHGSHAGEFVATLQLASSRRHWTASATLHPLRGSPRGPATGITHAGDAAFDTLFETEVIAPLVARVQRRMDETLVINDGGADLAQEVTLRQRYSGECALANFISDALVTRSQNFPQGTADLAIVNATAIADGLPQVRDVTFKDLYRMLPFADCLQVCRMRGRDLLAVLQSNAARALRPEEVAQVASINAGGYVSRGFVHFSRALRYTLRLNDIASNAAIENPTFDGIPLERLLERTFSVVLTNYLGSGGFREAWNGTPIGAGVPGRIAGFDLRALPRHDTGLVFRNEVIAHARMVGRIGAATGAARDGRLIVI